ncbi:hypothetical protein A246_23871 [Pseudomonas syringae pv. actinidiae ICMP 19098]|nr:hypothetical protein A246_23871 [Pseudomonas syringae pv. actinidiae ICMP 19098]
MNIWAYARRAWELQEVTTAAMGCEAALKSVTSIRLVYCGHWFAAGSRQFADNSAPTKIERSRTSEASPGQLPRPLARIRSRRVYDAERGSIDA